MQDSSSQASLEELRLLYERRSAEFARVAAAILNDGEAARDAVQEAFVRAIRNRDSFTGSGELGAWVWRIVVNVARDMHARRAEFPVDELASCEAAVENNTEAHRAARLAIRRLPERQRLSLFLRYYADMDYRTIAEILSVSPGTVASTLHDAHSTLRELIAEVKL